VGGFMGVVFAIVGFVLKYFSTHYLLNYLYNTVYQPDTKLDINTAMEEEVKVKLQLKKSRLMRKRAKGIQRIERELETVNFIRS
jgi:hypothetical protein